MLSKNKIAERLQEIYDQIPEFECKHCHNCEGPIIWFKPEEILIRDYLKKHNMKYIVWPIEKFENNKCPYLKNDRCSIYQVRPMVCRLQGTIPDLPCKYNKKKLMTKQQLKKLKKEFEILLRETDGIGIIYSTKKYF